jgi:hypothetical protein
LGGCLLEEAGAIHDPTVVDYTIDILGLANILKWGSSEDE